jgi:hypothetical protein
MKYYNFKKLRETDLNIVITTLFNGFELGTKHYHITRQYILPSNQKIAITGLKWFDNSKSIGGFGALDLVKYLGSVSLFEAADILEKMNNENLINLDIKPIAHKKGLIPEPCSETWIYVKQYLTCVRKIPEPIISELYNDLLIWSDKRKNCVFPRDNNTGAFLRGTFPNKPFKMTVGLNGKPYVIPGNNITIITEAPIDAISLRYYYPNATILATGGRIGFDKIEPYLFKSIMVLLAQDNDKSGDQQADYLSKFIHVETKRLRPKKNYKDWNEALQAEYITTEVKY